MSRPKIQIDENQILEMAKIHCSIEEMSAIVGCSRDTLERRFAATIHKGKQEGKKSLRRSLWQLALKGNLGALIWLSKQHLDMSEKIESKQEINAKAEINTAKESRDHLKKLLSSPETLQALETISDKINEPKDDR